LLFEAAKLAQLRCLRRRDVVNGNAAHRATFGKTFFAGQAIRRCGAARRLLGRGCRVRGRGWDSDAERRDERERFPVGVHFFEPISRHRGDRNLVTNESRDRIGSSELSKIPQALAIA
jgi:hypothetical protein